MAVTDPLLEFLAQKANDPRAPEMQRRVAQAIVNPGNPIMDRLAEHGKYLAGGDDGLSFLEAAAIPGRAMVGGAGVSMEATAELAKALSGAGAAAHGRFNPAVRAMPNARGSQSLIAAAEGFEGDGNLWQKARAANEAGARGHEVEYGVLNTLTDVTNLLPGPVDELAKLIKVGKARTALMRLLKGVPEVAAKASPPHLNPIMFAPDIPPPASIPAPPGRGSIDALREALWDAVDEAAVPPDVQKVNAFRQAIGEVADPPGDVPLSMWGNYSTRGNVGRKVGAALPPELGPRPPTPSKLPELFGQRGNAGKVLGPPLPAEASPLLRDLISETVPAPNAAIDPLLSPPPAASYDDFLQLARGVQGELPAPSSNFWQRLGADPATVGDFFARGVGENLLGQTHSGLYAVKPGALSRFVPTSTRAMIDRWAEESYGAGARKALPNLLKKLGADWTPEGVFRGDQNITDSLLSYLTDRGELTGRKAVDARYQQLLDEIAPAVDDAADEVLNVDIPKGAGDIAASATPKQTTAQDILNFQRLSAKDRAARTGDVYLDQRLPKVLSGIDRNGNEIYRFPHTPDYFLTSAMTGKKIRHYIELPNGARVHPDELSRLSVDTRTGAIRDRATGQLVQPGSENIPTVDELTQAKAALNAIGDRLDRAPESPALQRQWDEAKRKVWALEGQIASAAPTPNTPTGALPGMDMRPQFGGSSLTSIADAPLTQTAAPLKLEMQYGGMAPEAVQRVKQVDAGQGSLFGEAADEAESMIDEQLQLIEASPYFSVFHHFNPAGELKKVNPLTGKPLIVREGGKITQGRAEVWNIPGSGYDDVAAEAMAQVGGYNPRWAATAEEFWMNARDAFQQYKQLRKGTEIAPKSFMGDIAAGGGGGGGLGITPGMLPVGAATTLVGAGAGGIAGAGAGATAGFVQGEGGFRDKLGNAKEGALTGALLGAGVGALGGATLGKNTSGQALKHIVQRSNEAGIAGTRLALAGGDKAATRGGATEFVKGGLRYWAGQVVRHPKNLFNDELWNDLLTGALTSRSRQFIRSVRDGLAERAAMTDEWDRLPQSTMDLLALEGIDKAAWQAAEKLHGKGKGMQAILNLGTPLSHNMEDGALGMGKEMLYSTIMSGVNPQGFAQNALGVVAGGPVKGAVNTYWRQFFNSANGIFNNTFRHAALAGEAGKFRAMGRQALIDAGQTGFAKFSPDGMFSTADVATHLGAKEAAVWEAVQKNARELAMERVRFLYGDYGKKGMIENALGKMGIPFVSWALRAYPVAAEMALTHPVIALAIYQATKALAQGAGENGRPGYTAGSIPIRDEAGLLTGGQSNTTYLNLINSISPVGGEVFKGAEDTGYDKSTYQSVNEALDRIGLPGFGPVPAALAYILGFDFKGPSALSRTQGLENALGLLPGNPDLPDIGGGALRAARGAISPLVAGSDIGALLGATADPTPEQYDPIGRRYAELVVERTGKRLNDPANKAYLIDLMYGRGGLYEQAEREALLGGAARNLASLSSPVGTVSQTDTARHAKQATAANPFTYGAVSAIPQGTAARREAERGRKAALASDPWIEPYSIGGQAEAEDILLREIAERYRTAGARLTPAGLAEQLRLMSERAERTRIR